MEIVDVRKLSASAQEEKRRTAVKLWKKSESIAEIARTLDVSSRAVQNWINAYKVGGLKALSAKKTRSDRRHRPAVNAGTGTTTSKADRR